MNTRRDIRRGKAGQGAVAITFVFVLPVLLGVIGLAIDLSHLYVRHGELRRVADNAALAAARRLNGTAAGVTSALDFANLATQNAKYSFGAGAILWDNSALSLAKEASATTWTAASALTSDAAAAGFVFARVDTSKLRGINGPDLNTVEAFFAGILGIDSVIMPIATTAVAGPATVQLTPLAICALQPASPSGSWNHGAIGTEKLEYGFRRGVSYNLLDLNPGPGTTPLNYLVNPVDPGSGGVNISHFGAEYMKQFICSGTVGLPYIQGGSKLHIKALDLDLSTWLNSRFDDNPAGTGCYRPTAMPDLDVREYIGGYTNWYMAATPSPYPSTAAPTSISGLGRVTYADLQSGTADSPALAQYFGPLWTYAKAQKTDGTYFTLANWPTLYSFGGASVAAGNTTRYGAGSAAYGTPYSSAGHKSAVTDGVLDRRVLNLPLLDCSAGAPASPATVLAIGRFFMTARAKPAAGTNPAVIPGEFAGVLATGTPTSTSALYQ